MSEFEHVSANISTAQHGIVTVTAHSPQPQVRAQRSKMHILHRTLWCAVVACGWLSTSAEDSSTPEPTAQVTTQTPWRLF